MYNTEKGSFLFVCFLLFTFVYDKLQVFSVCMSVTSFPHPGLYKVEVTSLEEWLERNTFLNDLIDSLASYSGLYHTKVKTQWCMLKWKKSK